MTTRLVIILLVFFGLLYYFQGPLKALPAQLQQMHSPYAGSFKKAFNDVVTATSSAVMDGYRNYIPGLSGSSANQTTPPTQTSNGNQNSGSIANSKQTVNGTSKNNIQALLPVTSNSVEGKLTAENIVTETNNERAKLNLPSLIRNTSLVSSAEAKLQDMFQNQYFAHVSPSGENVSNVVTRAGYDYIVVGENLALGLFPSDESVVAAWMASPGHKKNILDSRYQEIGVAVGQGIYQGRKQWLIVQHFGKPLSACPSPSAELKQTITDESVALASLEQRITSVKAEVDRAVGTSDYWSKVDLYNNLVTDYNSKRDFLKAHLDTYNKSVGVFNDCVGTES